MADIPEYMRPLPRGRGFSVDAHNMRRATIKKWLCTSRSALSSGAIHGILMPKDRTGGVTTYTDSMLYDGVEVRISDCPMPSIGVRYQSNEYPPVPRYFMDVLCRELGVPPVEIINDEHWLMGRHIRGMLWFEIAGPLTLAAYRAIHREP